MQELRTALSYLTVPVCFLVAWTLYRRDLWRSYLFFCIGIVVEGLCFGISIMAPKLYARIYLVAQPVLNVLYTLMVLEVFRKVFVRFRGIARFAQRVVVISMLLAFIFSIASVGGDLSSGWSGSTLMQRYVASSRAVASALCIYSVLIAAFLVWMPIPLPPNTIRHSFLFFFYFFFSSGVYYILNTSDPGFIVYGNLIFGLLTLIALVSWLFLLKPAGEAFPTGGRGPVAPASRILSKLESINKSLSPPGE